MSWWMIEWEVLMPWISCSIRVDGTDNRSLRLLIETLYSFTKGLITRLISKKYIFKTPDRSSPQWLTSIMSFSIKLKLKKEKKRKISPLRLLQCQIIVEKLFWIYFKSAEYCSVVWLQITVAMYNFTRGYCFMLSLPRFIYYTFIFNTSLSFIMLLLKELPERLFTPWVICESI